VVVTLVSMFCRKMVYSLIVSISLIGISVLISILMQMMYPYNLFSQINLLNLYSHHAFVAMDDYFIVFSKLIHKTTLVFSGVLLFVIFISVIVITLNRRISRMVISS
ncbi:hypothetical protein, partial [Paenibacillus sp. 598K]|uniref:hypothetical protein n=1 Tax=Paenibacillus sp. 598K TaxID=1117987 RepID=UPI001C87914D